MRKFSRIAAWSLAALACAIGIACLVIVIINRNDRPVAAAATRIEQLGASRPAIRDEDNGFVFVSGFGAGLGQDPHALGVQQIAFAAKVTDLDDAHFPAAARAESLGPERAVSAAMKALASTCKSADGACLQALEGGGETIDAWLAAEGWLLERYGALLARPAWRDSAPFDIRLPLPRYALVLDGQRLLLLQAWQAAGRGDAAAVNRLLERDGAFWRMAFASSDMLISKMIARAAIARNFEWGNLILRRLPHGSATVPVHWHNEISMAERSMLNVSAGEYRYVVHAARSFESYLSVAFERTGEDAGARDLATAILMPTFQLQDYKNRYAELVTSISDMLDVPYKDFPAAVSRARALVAKASGEAFDNPLYNWPGNDLLERGTPDFVNFAVRGVDLEGLRRLALLAVELRQAKAGPGEVRARLRETSLREPYDGRPFIWDAGTASIVFVGLEAAPRGRYALPL